MASGTKRIIIDTDAGDDVDDVLAIAFAALHPQLELSGVTTVGCRAADRARLVRKVLSAAGPRGKDVRVAAGMNGALSPATAAQRAAGPVRLGGQCNHVDILSDVEREMLAPTSEHAVDLLIREIRTAPRPTTIICIGPLTNLATALCREPDLGRQIHQIAIMGAEIDLPRAEYNILSDPVAADHVLHCGAPLWIGTWSVTRQVVLDPEVCRRIAAHGSALTDVLSTCIERWLPLQTWKPGPVMYDLAPILWALDPGLFETRPIHLEVETGDHRTRGWTVEAKGVPNAAVTTAMDAAAARELYLQTLLGE